MDADRLLVFHVGESILSVPASAVRRVLPRAAVTPLPGAPPGIVGALNVAGTAVAVADPRPCLGLAAREPRLSDRMILVDTARRPLILVVDSVDGLVAYDSALALIPERRFPDLPMVKGLVVTPEGLRVIQDLEAFLTPGEGRAVDHALAALGAREEGRP